MCWLQGLGGAFPAPQPLIRQLVADAGPSAPQRQLSGSTQGTITSPPSSGSQAERLPARKAAPAAQPPHPSQVWKRWLQAELRLFCPFASLDNRGHPSVLGASIGHITLLCQLLNDGLFIGRRFLCASFYLH